MHSWDTADGEMEEGDNQEPGGLVKYSSNNRPQTQVYKDEVYGKPVYVLGWSIRQTGLCSRMKYTANRFMF